MGNEESQIRKKDVNSVNFAGSRSSLSLWSSPKRTAVSSSARRRTGEHFFCEFRNKPRPLCLCLLDEAEPCLRDPVVVI